MPRFRISSLLVLLMVVPLCLAAYADTAPGNTVLIWNPATGLRTELPVNTGMQMTIRFFHSYDRQWVEESFVIEDGRFVPKAVMFKDDSYDYRHQRYRCRQTFEKDKDRLLDIDPLPSDRLPVIRTRIAFTRSQLLILQDDEHSITHRFYQWGKPGQPLVFSIKQ